MGSDEFASFLGECAQQRLSAGITASPVLYHYEELAE
jgi:hypothetical protein